MTRRIFYQRSRRRRPPPAPRRRGRGFSVVELLTVLTVAALLLALILPAVLASRGAARSAACGNNLRQIGVALHNFVSREGHFPDGANLSAQGRLLDDLGASGLADAVLKADAAGAFGGAPAAGLARVAAAGTPTPLFVCPDDPLAGAGPAALPPGVSYAGNFGTGVRTAGFDGLFWFLEPTAWGAPRHIGPRHVKDGLSQTAAFSEVLQGAPDDPDPRRGMRVIAAGLAGEALAAECLRSAAGGPAPAARLPGRPYYRGGVETLYNHVLPPNGPHCLSGVASSESAVSAGSAHPGGAFTLLADGAVRFTPDAVDPAVWRALGSRAGGEVAEF